MRKRFLLFIEIMVFAVLLIMCILMFLIPIKSPEYSIKTSYQGTLDLSDNELRFIAENYEFVVTHSGQERVQKLKQYNPKIKVLRYLNIKGIYKSDELYNETLEKDLFQKDSNGQIVQNKEYNWYLADIANPKYIELFMQILRENKDSFEYFDGFFFDFASLSHPNEYKTEFDYNYEKEYFGYKSIFYLVKQEFPDKFIAFNGYCKWCITHSELQNFTGVSLLELSDAISFEGMTTSAKGVKYSSEQILQHLNDFEYITNLNKTTSFLEFGGDRLFSLATYLLVINKNSVYKYTREDINNLEIYPEYTLDLGEPVMKFINNNYLLKREFEKGIVFVNLRNTEYILHLDRQMQQLKLSKQLEWKKVNNLKVSPFSGAVLKY